MTVVTDDARLQLTQRHRFQCKDVNLIRKGGTFTSDNDTTLVPLFYIVNAIELSLNRAIAYV